MPKLKTHKGYKSRVKLSARGKVLRHRCGHSHLMASKSPKRRRKLRKETLVFRTIAKKIITLIGG